MTTSGSVRRAVAALTVGSFSVAALLGVLALLGSGDFGDTQASVLLTTLIVGLASIAVLCYLATAGTPAQLVGVAGGLVVLVPLASALWLTWSEYDGGDADGVWRALGVGIVAAATLAQASLLLALRGSRRSLRPLVWATLSLAGLLGVLVAGLILGDGGGDDVWRLIGVIAILDVLGTVVALAVGGGRDSGQAADAPTPSGDVQLPGPVLKALDERARVLGCSRDQLVREAVAAYLAADAGPAPAQSGM